MKILKIKLKSCGKKVHPYMATECGDYDLKHNDYVYCDECVKRNEEV